MSYIGTNKIGKMFLGSTEIGKAYLSEDLVYSSAGGGQVLPYDAEIEYLQSSGTQYIDTGINGQSVTRFVVKGYCNVNGSNNTQLLGGAEQGASTFFGARVNVQTHWYCTSNGNGLGDPTHNSAIDATINSTSSQTGSLTDLTNNTTYNFTSFGSSSWSFPNSNLLLFGGYSTRRSPNARCYSLQIYTDSGLVRDFIPVRVGQVGYMYDRISGQLFGNNGTGSFTLGNDITYTALDYIKFTGSQYLMFNYYTNPNTHIEIDMQFEANGNANNTSANNRWLGNYENTVMAFDSNFGGNANQYNEIFYWFNREYISSVWSQIYSNIYNRSTWIYNNNVVTFLGVNKTTETKTTTQTGKLTLGGGKLAAASFTIFNRHNLKVYSMKIYEGNTLLLDMAPKSDGTNNGLYDSVNHIFYTSQTATNLVGA